MQPRRSEISSIAARRRSSPRMRRLRARRGGSCCCWLGSRLSPAWWAASLAPSWPGCKAQGRASPVGARRDAEQRPGGWPPQGWPAQVRGRPRFVHGRRQRRRPGPSGVPLAPPGAGEAVGEGWADLPIAERPRLVHGARPQGPPVGGSARRRRSVGQGWTSRLSRRRTCIRTGAPTRTPAAPEPRRAGSIFCELL
ncbi:conserved hypothetical protein [Xanthomonas citri pv. citri]|nr:conserved hypothetical protein [Xanthomonas citri pv. citri]CEE25858.1 conserved hypothetical protein [Xanthomonas citri pv. citri]CEE27878.1 conserved hypothetical protein [Xanthomonas citri pv. citri]CEE29027.1 conserved hypothetical protein [Xanthomonas citri pv. citri]CEE52177.1 conserved hypothetical protein [Xanthomonas citri pv. citri]